MAGNLRGAGSGFGGQVFISYVREDKDDVDILHGLLTAAGVPVWRDTDSLQFGENWQEKIREAITQNALVFIACFSSHSAARPKSYQNLELRWAIDEYRSRPATAQWLLVVRFDDCEVPDFDLGGGVMLTSLPTADLFGERGDESRAQIVSTACRLLATARRSRTRRAVLIGGAGLIAASAAAVAILDNRDHAANPDPAASQAPPDYASTGPLGGPITGNDGYAYSVAFSPDGRTLASGSSDWKTRLWNVADPARPALLGKPFDPEDLVYSVAFRPDGQVLANGCADGNIRLWNTADPAHPVALCPPTLAVGDTLYSIAFSPDGQTLAVGSGGGTTWLWNVADPAHPVTLGNPIGGQANAVLSVAFSPGGHVLASGSADKTIWLFNVSNLYQVATLGQPLTGYTGNVYSVAFSPDGNTLASGSADGMIQLWNVTNPVYPVALGEPLTGHSSYVLSVAFRPDGRLLASGSADETIRLWDVANPAQAAALGRPLAGHRDDVLSVAFRPDGHILASGSADKTIRLWTISSR
jgi:WD40 repeat protein